MFEFFQGLLLGIVQGATEFLPVSSTGHLILVPRFFGWSDPGPVFDAIVHLGTLAALVFVYRLMIRDLLRDAWARKSVAARAFLGRILLACVPALALGVTVGSWIESSFRSPAWVAFQLALWGVVLWIADRPRISSAEPVHRVEDVGWRKSLFIGLSQALALFPGVSRSGITMTAGLAGGLDREAAVGFSFLIGIPVIAAAGAYGLLHAATDGLGAATLPMLIGGFLASFASGAFAIRFLRSYVARKRFTPFVIYRVFLAIVIFAMLG